jgi:hypothetical protein
MKTKCIIFIIFVYRQPGGRFSRYLHQISISEIARGRINRQSMDIVFKCHLYAQSS